MKRDMHNKKGLKPSRILLQLRELAQLFNSMDPSPFMERDLDADAEEYIVSWARELPRRTAFELVLHLAMAPDPERGEGVEEAVQHYFATRADMKRREMGLLMRRGRLSLMLGLGFLVACLSGAHLLNRDPASTAISILKEGLAILGWVAMWRPLEIYLYDWWPLWEDRRIFERLARMKVRMIAPEGVPAAESPALALAECDPTAKAPGLARRPVQSRYFVTRRPTTFRPRPTATRRPRRESPLLRILDGLISGDGNHGVEGSEEAESPGGRPS